MGANVREFTDANFQTEVLQASELVLVDFWAPWCVPCRQLGPVIEQLANENLGTLKVGKVNCDENRQMAETYQVSALPTLLLFRGGEVIGKMQGAQPKARLQAAIDQARG